MFLERVDIQRLRSIYETTLEGCDRFNILIGKNNSGKSNLIYGILGFFEAIKPPSILKLQPVFADKNDFYDRKTVYPIVISCFFSVSQHEIDVIKLLITEEVPQVSNFASNISAFTHVAFTVKFYHHPSPFSIVSKISLAKGYPMNSEDSSIDAGSYVTLLDVPDGVAPQFYDVSLKSTQYRDEASISTRLIKNFDAEDFSRAKSETGGYTFRYAYERASERRRNSATRSASSYSNLEAAFNASKSYIDFQNLLLQRAGDFEKEAEAIEKTSIQGSFQTVRGQERVVPHYVNEICRMVAEVKILYQGERREPIGQIDAQRLLSLRVRRGGDRLFRSFQDTVSALIGVEIDAYEDDTSPSQFVSERGRVAKLDVDNFIAQANGSGIREALRLMINIELENPAILLIEEPEIHLHPSLETTLMRYLKTKSTDAQVFLTSHSTNFIDSGDYSTIQFVRKDAHTKSTLLTIDQAADLLPDELGLRLSSLFMYEKLVFVEGASDEDVLREWASITKFNLSRANVGFITLGGSRNIHHFAAKKTTDFLAKRGVKIWFVMDRDETSDDDLSKLKDRLGDKCSLRMLPVREIENYFLDPGVLIRYIEVRYNNLRISTERRKVLSAEYVSELIEMSANSLKSYSFLKFVSRKCSMPVYIKPSFTTDRREAELIDILKKSIETAYVSLKDRIDNIDDTINRARVEFDEKWIAGKHAIIPGDELLNLILSNFDMSYHKHRDAKQIASIMEIPEIPTVVKALFSEIAPQAYFNT